jgi:hypothetical protein
MNSNTTVMTEPISGTSPHLKARIAGVFYLLAVPTAAFAEEFLRGKWAVAAGLIAVSCFIAVTLLLYSHL